LQERDGNIYPFFWPRLKGRYAAMISFWERRMAYELQIESFPTNAPYTNAPYTNAPYTNAPYTEAPDIKTPYDFHARHNKVVALYQIA
jgi:hypothetical protein